MHSVIVSLTTSTIEGVVLKDPFKHLMTLKACVEVLNIGIAAHLTQQPFLDLTLAREVCPILLHTTYSRRSVYCI